MPESLMTTMARHNCDHDAAVEIQQRESAEAAALNREAAVRVGSGDLFGVWVSVSERLPKTGRRVLVTALNGTHVWRTVAQYWPAGTMDASNWDDPPEDWWDENNDNCTNPEAGWYEAQIETETNYLLTGVTHWMPLPPSPNIGYEPRDCGEKSKT